jgi:hypothetical protein
MALPQTKKTGNRANVGPLFRFSGIGLGMADAIELGRNGPGAEFPEDDWAKHAENS